MFQGINIPNKDNYNKPQNKIVQNNFRNINNFEPFVSKNEIFKSFKGKEQMKNIVISEGIDKESSNFMVLNSLTGLDKDIVENEDEEDEKKEEDVKNKSLKLDTLSTVFIGSLSVIGLYCVYKAIRMSK
mgnify:CR=1 FL=1|tara:strand:+ start:35154 stop:35540 length:387 start_codon:yes stop_codon:yes gene_type:complete